MRHYFAINIRQVKKILTDKFPNVQFTYGTSGRGRNAGNCVSWTGGPLAIEVRTSVPYSTIKHFLREMTETERDTWLEKQDREHAEYMAGEPARAAARKADGIAKAKATREQKSTLRAQLAQRWPTTEFTIEITRYGEFSSARFTWTDGPEIKWVTSWLHISKHQCTRTESPEHKAARIKEDRMIRRLLRARQRPAIIAKAIRRRALAYSTITSRKARESAQLTLCLT